VSLHIWTPEQGASGLIIIPKPTPILLVSGGRIQTWTPQPSLQTSTPVSSNEVNVHRTASGILIVKNRPSRPRRVIGHPELANGARVQKDDTLYVSLSEAIYRQNQGEDVEMHFASTPDDDKTLAYTKEQVWKQWDNDRLPDGWTRPRSASPVKRDASTTKSARLLPSQMDASDLTAALERLRNLRAG
jgi:hypothetical protein